MILLKEAQEAIDAWKRESEFEVAGGVWKGKPSLHDIDVVVERENLQAFFGAVEARKVACPIEIYIPLPGHADKLLTALRATTYQAIKGRLMSGVRFNKIRV